MPSTAEVAKKLIELCNADKNVEAIDTLYAEEIVSIEAVAMPNMPQQMTGKPAIRAKNLWWREHHEVHSSSATAGWDNGDKFVVHFKMDVTHKAGPMDGKRMKIEEIALYTVKDGKITKEEFFYPHQ